MRIVLELIVIMIVVFLAYRFGEYHIMTIMCDILNKTFEPKERLTVAMIMNETEHAKDLIVTAYTDSIEKAVERNHGDDLR